MFVCRHPEHDHHQDAEEGHCQLQQRRWHCEMTDWSLAFWYSSLRLCLLSAFSLFPVVNRRTRWRSPVGRTSMEMCSAHLSIPWYLAPCWDLASSSSAWFSLLSVSTLLSFYDDWTTFFALVLTPKHIETVCVVVVAMLGMLSPSSRGALMTTACFLFMFMG